MPDIKATGPIPFYVEFDRGRHKPVCIEASDKWSAIQLARQYTNEQYDIVSCERLPYPSSPRVAVWYRDGDIYCPSFCWMPTACKGRSSCPRSTSCAE